VRASPILLDTCAAIWTTQADGLSEDASVAIEEAGRAGVSVFISPMTAWEIGMLVSKGRLALSEDPQRWLDALLEAGVEMADMSPAILLRSSFLPMSTLRDPTDRIIVATARTHGYRIMTRDRPILDYAAAGHVQAIGC
jgi:PIN domain nuclease of toxin-antitoxin system